MRIAWTAVALLLATSGTALADVYYLKDGGKIEGRGEDRGTELVIHVPLGSITVAKSSIARVVRKQSILDVYDQRKAATPRQAKAWYALAMWCEAAGLSRQAQTHLREVLDLDTHHADARRRLGFIRVGHRWLTEDEHHEWLGEIRFRGRWMPPETVAAILEAEAIQRKLAAAPRKAAPQPAKGAPKQPPVKAGPQGNGGQNNGGQNKPSPNQPILLSRSIRPSQGFLDKYFVTNPFNVGLSGARVGGSPQRYDDPAGRPVVPRPVYYGPYHGGYGGALGRTSGVGVYLGGGYGGFGTFSTSSFGLGRTGFGRTGFGGSGFGGGGLGLRYGVGSRGDDFVLRGALGAGRGFVGHSFFGTFRAGSSRFSFGVR